MSIIDDDKKSVIIGIRLGKKDEDLKSWFLAIKKKELEQSFFIKKVIEAYLKKEPIQIGKVHYVKYDEPYKTSYTVSPQDIDTLSLIKTLESNNIKVSSFLKNILRKAITIIPQNEEEYIPNYFNMYDIENMFSYDKNNKIVLNEQKQLENQNENKINNHSIETKPTETKTEQTPLIDREVTVTRTESTSSVSGEEISKIEINSKDLAVDKKDDTLVNKKEDEINKNLNNKVPIALKFVKMGK